MNWRALNARRLSTPLLLVGIAALAVAAGGWLGCLGGELSGDEEQLVRDIVLSGLEHPQDPYVRAETLRAVKLTGDPDIAAEAEDLLGDRDPMVRVAALRTLLRIGELDAPYRAVRRAFRQAQSPEEGIQILTVALANGDERARSVALERAVRDESPQLRLRALEEGLIADIEEARTADEDRRLNHDLLPELREHVDDPAPQIAAAALEVLLASGIDAEVQQLVETLEDEEESIDDRLRAGRILMLARAEGAEDAFRRLLDGAGEYDPDVIGFPEETVDERVLRTAVLGLTALGDPEYVRPAQDYLGDVDDDTALDVLAALGPNPAEDAAITLRTHARDARPRIRQRAVELYAARDDARSDALFGALRQRDFMTRQIAITILTDDFFDDWLQYVTENLQATYAPDVDSTLRLLQSHLRHDDELAVLEPLQSHLEQLAIGEELPFSAPETDDEEQIEAFERTVESIQNRAAYLLFRLSDDGDEYADLIDDTIDPETRSAYLEYLATHTPRDHAGVLRDHLHDDLYVHRLMAAVGLWRAFSDSATWSSPTADDPEPTDES